MKIKKKDFVEIEYIGMLKENNKIFDLTDEKLAKKEGVYIENIEYGPVVVCVGEKNVLKKIDESLEGKDVGEHYKIELTSEEGFGKRDPKLIKLVSAGVFKKSDLRPVPGLRVNIENMVGIIRTVSGGRVSIDFNHPLSGKELIYDINILKKVDDIKEKIKACMKFTGLKEDLFEIKEKEDKKFEVIIKHTIPNMLKKTFESKIRELILDIKEIDIKSSKKE